MRLPFRCATVLAVLLVLSSCGGYDRPSSAPPSANAVSHREVAATPTPKGKPSPRPTEIDTEKPGGAQKRKS
jgi:hypothetical protein